MNFWAPAPFYEQGHAVAVKNKKGRGISAGEGGRTEPGTPRGRATATNEGAGAGAGAAPPARGGRRDPRGRSAPPPATGESIRRGAGVYIRIYLRT